MLPVLKEIGAPNLVAHTGLARSSVYDVLAGAVPHLPSQRRYRVAAINHARQQLAAQGTTELRNARAALWLYRARFTARSS